MSKIPKFIKNLTKDQPNASLIDQLKATFESGGCDIEPEWLIKCKRMAKSIAYISSSPRVKNQKKINFNQFSGNWLYCGFGWYVRKLNNKFEYAQYVAWDTAEKKIVGLWEDDKHEVK